MSTQQPAPKSAATGPDWENVGMSWGMVIIPALFAGASYLMAQQASNSWPFSAAIAAIGAWIMGITAMCAILTAIITTAEAIQHQRHTTSM